MRRSRPERGSRAFYPRKRARRIYPRQNMVNIREGILGFAGYKAGMIHLMALDNDSNSPTYGMKIFVPATVIEVPPLSVFGFRVYTKTYDGLKVLQDVFSEKIDKKLKRKTTLGKGKIPETKPEDVDIEKAEEIRLMVHTNPPFKKTPEIFEIGLGGSVEAQMEKAKELLGKTINVEDVFKEGEYVDVTAVTKGHGFQGPVKRFGIKLHGRKMKQMHRHVGVLGARGLGRILPTVPAAGQHGYQTRTELNKLILKIVDGSEITPKSGFPHYGLVKNKAILIKGSVPGPQKRLIRLRPAIRAPKPEALEVKQIVVN